jgi:hypothetical protein
MNTEFARAMRFRILVVSVIGVGGYWTVPAAAETRTPTHCGDSGPGSLRDTVAVSADGDIIDVSGIACPLLVTSGEIVIPQNNLTIRGVRTDSLTEIRGDGSSRLLNHIGSGTLRLHAILLNGGRHAANLALGGCLHSKGHVELLDTALAECVAVGEGGVDPMALGGGVHARSLLSRYSVFIVNSASGVNGNGGAISTEGRVTLFRTLIARNTAANGGGVSTLGGATITYSTIEQNFASHDNGGVQASGGSVTVNKSVLNNNRAVHRCGGLCVSGPGRTSVIDSTVATNQAIYLGAGELSDDAEVLNSTIAFNEDTARRECVGSIRARRLRLQSSIVASNRCFAEGQHSYDIGGRPWEGYTVTGKNNLVGRSRVKLPADTLSVDPRLGFLSRLGGPTSVLPLMADSPAIDRGNNLNNRQYDQRGPGFPRVVGGRADIGAYEVQAGD